MQLLYKCFQAFSQTHILTLKTQQPCNDNSPVNSPAEEHSELLVIPHTAVLVRVTGLEEKNFQ